MQGFWITFTDGTSGYCQGQSPYDAKRIAEKLTGKKVPGNEWKPELPPLPYPASPVIWQLDHPVTGKCPPFCDTPEQCKGKTSCPKNYTCSN
jgi:hypothetical protein